MDTDRGPVRPLIDPDAALRTASLVVGRRHDDRASVEALRRAVHADLPAIDAAARAWSRLGADLPPTRVRVVGRTGWLRANLANLEPAMAPLRDRLAHRSGTASRVLGAQIGLVLGLLSTKVLGQYVLPLGGPGSGALVVVGPNVLDLADRHGPLATDIRRTVLLHEVTHRLQFDATPWLGDHLRDLVRRYVSDVRVDKAALAEALPRLPEAIAAARVDGDIEPVLRAVLTPTQMDLVAEAQGLMSLLEGHGNAAMYAATGDLVEDPAAVREALAARHGDVTSKVLTAVAGMEMKRRQYREGEAFVRTVIDTSGVEGLNRAFAVPEALPGADEITDPRAWLARTAS